MDKKKKYKVRKIASYEMVNGSPVLILSCGHKKVGKLPVNSIIQMIKCGITRHCKECVSEMD